MLWPNYFQRETARKVARSARRASLLDFVIGAGMIVALLTFAVLVLP